MPDYGSLPKTPKRRQRPKMKKQRRDYKSKRDSQGRYATTDRSVASRRYIRALRRKTANKRVRKTSKTIYNEKGGLKSPSQTRSGKRRGTAKNNSKRTRR